MRRHPAVLALVREIDAYLARTGMLPTQFGLAAMNDGNFIPRLMNGRTPTLETIDKVRRYMAESNGRTQQRRG